MKSIVTYFESLYRVTATDEEYNKVWDLEHEVYEMDDKTFGTWCDEHDIDLAARTLVPWGEELAVTVWMRDMEG